MDETREEYIKRLAYNRWQIRQHHKWLLNQDDKDDFFAAERQVEAEEKYNASRID